MWNSLIWIVNCRKPDGSSEPCWNCSLTQKGNQCLLVANKLWLFVILVPLFPWQNAGSQTLAVQAITQSVVYQCSCHIDKITVISWKRTLILCTIKCFMAFLKMCAAVFINQDSKPVHWIPTSNLTIIGCSLVKFLHHTVGSVLLSEFLIVSLVLLRKKYLGERNAVPLPSDETDNDGKKY